MNGCILVVEHDRATRELLAGNLKDAGYRVFCDGEVGAILSLSSLTVKNHVQKILHKLNVVNRTQAVVKALDTRILRPCTLENRQARSTASNSGVRFPCPPASRAKYSEGRWSDRSIE